MENNEKKPNSLFEEAQKESMQKLLARKDKVENQDIKDKISKAVKERIESGETQWDLLKRMLDGSMTERFINAMDAMNDAQFVKTYLKLLEYSKPKVTRVEGGDGEVKDLTVNIQTMIINDKGEKEFIGVNELHKMKKANG